MTRKFILSSLVTFTLLLTGKEMAMAQCDHSLGSSSNYFIPDFKFQYTPEPIFDCTGYSLIAEVGRKNFRANGTVGWGLANRHFFKISSEYLIQDLNYKFSSGQIDQWMNQVALGAAYQIELDFCWLSGASASAWWSHARSKNLNTVICPNQVSSVFRHIAGSSAGGADLGVTVIPWERSRLEVKLNYDIVQYRRVFEPILHVSGLGSTIDFLQKLACNIDLNLRGEFRRPFNFYKAAINWHAPADWNYWTVGVYTSYTQGGNTLPNNAVVGLELSYVFGGNNSRNDGWMTCPWDLDWNCCDPCGTDPKLLSWVSSPAVMLPEVLAIADQLVVEIDD